MPQIERAEGAGIASPRHRRRRLVEESSVVQLACAATSIEESVITPANVG